MRVRFFDDCNNASTSLFEFFRQAEIVERKSEADVVVTSKIVNGGYVPPSKEEPLFCFAEWEGSSIGPSKKLYWMKELYWKLSFSRSRPEKNEGLRYYPRLIDGPSFGPFYSCLLYTSPSPRDRQKSRMPSSA